MGLEWIATALAAAGSAASSFAGQHPSKARRYAKEMALFNNDIAVKNWQMQNAYDSPAEQMKRYQAAGLNPNLIYGQQNTGGTIQSGSADFDASAMVPNEGKALQGVANAISTYQQIRSQQIQNQNANLAGKLTEEEIKQRKTMNDILESTKEYQIESKALAVQHQSFMVLMQNMANYQKTIAKANVDIARLREIAANIKVKDAQYEKIMEEVKNLEEYRDLIQAQVVKTKNQAKAIEEMLPFQKQAMSGSAASSFANAAVGGKRYQWYDTVESDKHANNVVSGPPIWSIPGMIAKAAYRDLNGGSEGNKTAKAALKVIKKKGFWNYLFK